MKKIIEITKQIRTNFIHLTEGLSLDRLNKTPDKFNNNLIWNFGHTIITQQNLTYKLAAIASSIPVPLIEKYSKGTKPYISVSQQEVETLNQLAFTLLDQFEEDYNKQRFSTFTTYQTSSGLVLNNIENAMLYNMVHENLHYGFCFAIKKLI
ncbi:MAG: DinB family protein [Chitinophagaceae bacterium]